MSPKPSAGAPLMTSTADEDYSDVDASTVGGSTSSRVMLPTAKYRPSRSTPPPSSRSTRGRSSSQERAGSVAGLAPRDHLRPRTGSSSRVGNIDAYSASGGTGGIYVTQSLTRTPSTPTIDKQAEIDKLSMDLALRDAELQKARDERSEQVLSLIHI